MPAQTGNAIILDYGAQGAQQSGGAVLLDYSPVIAAPTVPVCSNWGAPWQTGQALDCTTTATPTQGAAADTARLAAWNRGQAHDHATQAAWTAPRQAAREVDAPWAWRGRAIDNSRAMPWGHATPTDHARTAPWHPWALHLAPDLHGPWGGSKSAEHAVLGPWGLTRALPVGDHRGNWAGSRPEGITQWIPWTRYSREVGPGWGIPSPPGPQPNQDGTWIVPILQAYIVLNETSLTRASDGAVIPVMDLSLSLDSDAWTWSWRASAPWSARALLIPGPVDLQANINGVPIRLVCESMQRQRSFGADRIALSGRGRNAELGAPAGQRMAFGVPSTMTAAQLMAEVLSDNGIPLPWGVDFGLTDWTIPAGVWSLQGTRMDALQAIAAAAGGYLQPHDTDPTVIVRHRYPTAPWEWATMTPDYQLPAEVVQQEGTEWRSRPAVNRVFVSGESAGVLADVTRTGSAGDVLADMVTDSLITHTDAARQRGLAILADSGNQVHYTLRLPVLEETGVIVPGKSVRYTEGSTDRIGLVRSTAVEVRGAQVWQQIIVETRP